MKNFISRGSQWVKCVGTHFNSR